jgi:hypothetical protein
LFYFRGEGRRKEEENDDKMDKHGKEIQEKEGKEMRMWKGYRKGRRK